MKGWRPHQVRALDNAQNRMGMVVTGLPVAQPFQQTGVIASNELGPRTLVRSNEDGSRLVRRPR
jgi:hypothetical protein